MSANTAGLSWRRTVTPVIVVATVLMVAPIRAAAQAPSGQKPPAAAPSPQAPPKPGAPSQAKAAAPPARSAAAPAGPTFTFQGFGSVGYVALAANQTFDAVLGSSGGLVFGGGATVTHRRGYFGRVSIEHFSGDGERVFVFGSDVYPLGIPLSVSNAHRHHGRLPLPASPLLRSLAAFRRCRSSRGGGRSRRRPARKGQLPAVATDEAGNTQTASLKFTIR